MAEFKPYEIVIKHDGCFADGHKFQKGQVVPVKEETEVDILSRITALSDDGAKALIGLKFAQKKGGRPKSE